MAWIEAVSKFVGAVGVASACLAWVAKALVTHWLSRETDHFKQNLQDRANKELETTKHQLKAEFDKELALFQAALRERSFATETIIARLYERQLDVVAELYKRLSSMHLAFQSLMAPFQAAGVPSQEEKRALAATTGNAFLEYYRANKIFLSGSMCETIDKFVAAHNDAWFEYVQIPDIWAGSREGGVKSLEARMKAWHLLIGDAARLLSLVETEFRQLTGVLQQEHVYARAFHGREAVPGGTPAVGRASA